MCAASVVFVAMLLLQSSAIHVGHLARRELASRSLKSVVADIESTLQTDCGDECLQVLHAFLPTADSSHNKTNTEMWQSVLEKISLEGSRQAIT